MPDLSILTPDQLVALDIARDLVKAGVPVFVAPPCPMDCQVKGHSPGVDFHLPRQWDTSRPTMDVVDRWKPGWALAAVGGHAADFLDTDPRNGGIASALDLRDAGHFPRTFGQAATPSQGTHHLISPTGERKGSPIQGIDLQSGAPDGTGRGFVYIAPTVRVSKFGPRAGEMVEYRWIEPPDVETLAEFANSDDSTQGVIDRMQAQRAARNSPAPHVDGAGNGETREFTRAQAIEFCRPHIEALKAARPGSINDQLNITAKVMSHFGDAFWSYADAERSLMKALESTEYDGATWQADTTIRSAYGTRGGDWQAVLKTGTEVTTPEASAAIDQFTDARLADTVGDGLLRGAYCRTTALGWLRWDGRRWDPCEDGTVTEAVRQYALRRYMDALDAERRRMAEGQESDMSEVNGWRKVQSASRIKAVLSLAGNVNGVLRDAAEFDTDPDILNTPGGVWNLLTGEREPHSPDRCITKITAVDYVPGAAHPAWQQALAAVPESARGWLRLRLGQALTGHMTDDERMVLMTGEGSNGKTTIMNAVFQAMGGYAASVPNSLLITQAASGGPSPEKMTLQGVRLAYIEETPEGRHLDTQALKEVVGTPNITARQLYKGLVTFGVTHSLFINTNHPPRVAETDNGTWRRLCRIDFPYRFRPAHEPLEGPNDRHGTDGLKRELKTQAALEAVLAWLMEGVADWRDRGCTLAGEDPEEVQVATRTWRHQSDIVLRFMDECLEFDRDRFVPTTALYKAYTEWSRANGHRDTPSNLFLDRIKTHTGLPGFVTLSRTRVRGAEGLSMPSVAWLGGGELPVQATVLRGVKFPETR